MAESSLHRFYVQKLVLWFKENVTDWNQFVVYCDDGSVKGGKPPQIDGFIPDFYALAPSDGRVIIGEAKTGNDLESKHSRLQIEAYIRFCAAQNHSLLVIAVPWTAICSAKSLVRSINRKIACLKVKDVYIDALPEHVWEEQEIFR